MSSFLPGQRTTEDVLRTGDALNELLDVGRKPGHQRPAGFGIKSCSPRFELDGRIGDGIGGDRDEKDVLAKTRSQPALQIAKTSALPGTDQLARGIGKVNRHDLALDQIGKEAVRFSVLVYYRHVRYASGTEGLGQQRHLHEQAENA